MFQLFRQADVRTDEKNNRGLKARGTEAVNQNNELNTSESAKSFRHECSR